MSEFKDLSKDGGATLPRPEMGDDLQARLASLERELEEMAIAYDRLNQSNLELLELDHLKSEFIGTVSHELKTPLTTLLGYVEYLQAGKLGPMNEQQARAVESMARSLRKLHRQISELLDFIRLESGKLTVEPEEFDLRPLLEEALASQRVLMEKKDLKAEVLITIDIRVVADRERIAQVLDNLVANAARFTDQGGITIAAEPALGGKVRISVTDTGTGIPEEALPRIFDRFYQVDGPSDRRKAGMGLGLAIVKAILLAHGSKIEARSQLGQGSTFSFELPLAAGR